MNKIEQDQECEMACARLCIDFAHFVDTRDYEKLVGLFTEEGTFERRGEVLQGRQSILSGMQARPANVITRHVCTNIRIQAQVDGSVLGSCYLLLFHGAVGEAAATSPGPTIAEYSDVYVTGPDGWRIRSRVATLAF
jgi:hypothetical protein